MPDDNFERIVRVQSAATTELNSLIHYSKIQMSQSLTSYKFSSGWIFQRTFSPRSLRKRSGMQVKVCE
jgi:hypothetical protein